MTDQQPEVQRLLSLEHIKQGWHGDHECHRNSSSFEWFTAGALFAQSAVLAKLQAAEQAEPVQEGELRDEREAFIHWMTTTYPDVYTREEAEHYWRHKHVSRLAWQAATVRAALSARKPACQSDQANSDQQAELPSTGDAQAWMRPSIYPECLPETTADPEIAQSWRDVGHVVTELRARGKPARKMVALSEDLKRFAIQQMMDQAQVFASAWSMVGGQFDFGNALEDAEQAREDMRGLVTTLVNGLVVGVDRGG